MKALLESPLGYVVGLAMCVVGVFILWLMESVRTARRMKGFRLFFEELFRRSGAYEIAGMTPPPPPRTPPSDETVFIYRPEFYDRMKRLLHGTAYQRAVAYAEIAYPGMQISHADSLVLGDAGLYLERELRRKGLRLVPDGGEDLRVEKAPPDDA